MVRADLLGVVMRLEAGMMLTGWPESPLGAMLTGSPESPLTESRGIGMMATWLLMKPVVRPENME